MTTIRTEGVGHIGAHNGADNLQSDLLTINGSTPDYCIIHKIDKGQHAYCGRVDLTLFGQDDDLVDDHIRESYGPGTYKIDFRKNGKRGSCAAGRQVTIAQPMVRAEPGVFPRYGPTAPAAPVAAAAPPGDFMMNLLVQMMQMNQQVLVALINKPSDTLTAKDVLTMTKSTKIEELEAIARFGTVLAGKGESSGGGGGGDGGGSMAKSIMGIVQGVPAAIESLRQLQKGPSQAGSSGGVVHGPGAARQLPPASAPVAVADVSEDDKAISEAQAKLGAWIKMLNATADAPNRDAEQYADILIDAIGPDFLGQISAMDNLTIINTLKAQYPEVALQAPFIAQVIDAARRLLSGPDPTQADGEVVDDSSHDVGPTQPIHSTEPSASAIPAPEQPGAGGAGPRRAVSIRPSATAADPVAVGA